jgi:AraC-like DNA-binding protein/mannose-6-phosphate isomerase-like protein (cupin superfamily)
MKRSKSRASRDPAAALAVTRVRVALYQEKGSRFRFRGEQHGGLFEIFCLDRGRASVQSGGRRFAARPGDCFLYWPGHFHRHQASGGDAPHYLTVAFEARGAESLRILCAKRWPLPAPLRTLLARVVGDGGSTLGAAALQRARLTEFLVEWLRLAHAEDAPSARPGLEAAYLERAAGTAVGKALEFVEARYASGESLDEAARAAGVSPPHLRRLVRELTGRTLRERRLRLRIQRAKHLLSQGGYNVKVVAGEVGYESVAAFCRSFKAVEGVSPTAYARSIAARGPTPLPVD